MSKLNRDVLYLIFKELKYDTETLRSCLSVNKIWCEIVVPILWKNPWNSIKCGKEKLLSVIISHLSDKSRKNLIQHFNFLINSYQKPLFDYISFCRHLNFDTINNIINTILYTNINDNVLTGLIEICESINIQFQTGNYVDESFCKILENSLIKHANNIEYFKITKQPFTKILSSLINLKRLELSGASSIPIEALTSLIENTNGSLIEIRINRIVHEIINNKRIIHAIYQNCPNLRYLKLFFSGKNFLELEKLLIKCQYLNGLFILIDWVGDKDWDWDILFEILSKSSPTSLFKFKFTCGPSKLSLKSMSLQFDYGIQP
ncbi:hypothetical protein C1645_828334 [Glomus cerebriforme]|uniref:F-box domain-containing protein n=1 Tax=Glomus cerebriforme TaxID=658196 RepID=A0A397SWD0_9GLOM|nr:hypothetical protein C1645_828334 [Glomus cerebriforme]